MKNRWKLNFSQKMYRWPATGLLVVGLLLQSNLVLAAEKNTDLVEVEPVELLSEPYLKRRDSWGAEFSLIHQQFNPTKSISALDGANYETIFASKPVGLTGIEFKYKLNLPIVSLLVGPHFMSGTLSGNQDRKLEVTQSGLSFDMKADGIYEEPWIVPYLGLQLWKMSIKETSPTSDFKADTNMGTAFRAGLQFNLNYLDAATAFRALKAFGIDNSYIGIGIVSYQKASSDDFNTESSPQLSVSISVEI